MVDLLKPIKGMIDAVKQDMAKKDVADNALAIVNECYEDKQAREQTERQAFINHAFLNGRQWLQWNDTSKKFETDNKVPPYRVRLVVNKILPIFLDRLSKFLKNAPVTYVEPATQSEEDHALAKIGTGLIDHLYRITNNEEKNQVLVGQFLISGISYKHILFEPESKNTLAPIGLLTRNIYYKDKGAIILTLPSDHYIKNESRFIKILTQAISVAKKGLIVTLGIIPNKPETGYGYIKINSKIKDLKAFQVERFIEKPALAKAKRFMKDKSYFWNSGMFVFRADIMLEEIKKFSPHSYGIINKIKDNKSLNKLWKRSSSLSIDYAVMEKTDKMILIPADFGWIDLGSWQAIEEIAKKDKNGNIFKCRYNNIDLGSRNTLVWSDCRFVATLGLNNVIIVDTKDALLVCAKEKAQEIKSVVKILKQRHLDGK